MKLKLDENLGRPVAGILRAARHDVATVVDQRMTSATDVALIEACLSEGRALVSLDLDFANPLRFPPSRYAGIAVLRPSARPSGPELEEIAKTLVLRLEQSTMEGRLWIVEHGRVREYAPDASSGGSEAG